MKRLWIAFVRWLTGERIAEQIHDVVVSLEQLNMETNKSGRALERIEILLTHLLAVERTNGQVLAVLVDATRESASAQSRVMASLARDTKALARRQSDVGPHV